MFADNQTKELAKAAYEIMTRNLQVEEEETTPQAQLAESASTEEVQDLANLLDTLVVEAVSQYIGLYEEEIQRELNDEEITEMTTKIMQEIEELSEEAKVNLGEALLDTYNKSLTED